MCSQKRHPGMQEVERRPEIKVVFSQCCYSMLLRLLTVTCGPGQQVFLSTRLRNSPKQAQTYQGSRFQERISVTTFLTVESSLQFSVQQVHPKTSRRWWLRARSRSKRLIHCDFIVHLCFFKKNIVMKNKIEIE